ncbi:MAG: ParB/RepB/Spo0J family partition protein [Prevotella sp.]|nr:ParB/RepB/Spo0J family partition protein [Prevotella sp.]
MEIKVTRDYSLFKKLEGNRSVKKRNALVKSIKEFDLTRYSPIIVSDDFRIVDGQHRFEACKELDLPIYFVVMPSDNAEKAMIVLNKYQSQWRNEEFFQYSVEKLGGSYKELKDYIDKYKIQLSYAVLLFPVKPFETAKVRDENFIFDKYEHCDELAEYYLSPEFRRLPFWKSKPFVRAIRYFFEKSDSKQRDKLKKKSLAIPQCASHIQYNVVFENLIKMRR